MTITRHLNQYVVLIAGSRWENTHGTDHRLAMALATHHRVLWVDPPVPIIGPAVVDRPRLGQRRSMDRISAEILRLRVLVPPGPFRIGVREIANFLMWRAIRKALKDVGGRSLVTLTLSPSVRLPRSGRAVQVLHVTDDWLAGAELMGLSRRHVERILRHNLHEADVVTAVTPHLASTLRQLALRPDVSVVPNGCEIPTQTKSMASWKRMPAVGLVGQLNERLDFDLLDQIADTGMPIEVIGPRREHDAVARARLDGFLGRANVTWFGEVPAAAVPGMLERVSVGITPYASNEFNHASFPLKTLEYLSAGLPVVATDSPAVQWLNTELIKVAQTEQEFIRHVIRLAHQPFDEYVREKNQTFARMHSWNARAEQLMQLADSVDRGVIRGSLQIEHPAGGRAE